MDYVTQAASRSASSAMTEARVRDVMQKVAANLSAFVVAGLITRERAIKWITDLTYLQIEECLDFFELQLGGRSYGLRYTVRSDGSVQMNSASGGLDIYGIPFGTAVQLYADLRMETPQSVYDYLAQHGWGFDGRKMEAPESEHRSFSKEGYAITRARVGTWP
ncbi:MAG: hypothetical protein IVW54_19110 [Candidatus Binataceae bacterium]|nr:hypothetical protein [Candidatus Binataceae bacterium]